MIFESTNITTVGLMGSYYLNPLLISSRMCTLEPTRLLLAIANSLALSLRENQSNVLTFYLKHKKREKKDWALPFSGSVSSPF